MKAELIQAYTALYTGSITASKNEEFLRLFLNNFKNLKTLEEKLDDIKEAKGEIELLQETHSVIENMKIKLDFEKLYKDHLEAKYKKQVKIDEELREAGIDTSDTDSIIGTLDQFGISIKFVSIEEIKPHKEHPIGLLLYEKIKNQIEIMTYENLINFQKDGYLSPNFYLWGSKSGRMISYNPSLQNLPKYYKDYILPNNNGESVYELDIKSAEILGIAYLANETNVFNLLKNQIDIYSFVFSKLFNKKIEDVSSEQRDLAKKLVNALNLGAGSAKIAQMINVSKLNKKEITQEQASLIKKEFFNLFPKLAIYLQQISDKETLTTALGFPFAVEPSYKNMSFPAQNIIATCIKTILASLVNYKERIINVVHDSLWISVKGEELNVFKEIMENIIAQLVPEEYMNKNLELIKITKLGGE